MWKVMFPSPDGSQPSIYWVTADSAPAAETAARQQAGSRIPAEAPASVEHADDVNPEGEVWPRPRLVDGIRVFTFDDSRTAYDQTQVRDDIHFPVKCFCSRFRAALGFENAMGRPRLHTSCRAAYATDYTRRVVA
jgi:hypothetical protein